MPPHINIEDAFREMKLRSHYEKSSERKTRERQRERQREKHEKTPQRKAGHVVAIGSASEDKKA
jgi:ribosomal protein S21